MSSSEDEDVEDVEDAFDKQYQEGLTEFCRGKRSDAFRIWNLLLENPLATVATQAKVAFSLAQCYNTGTGTEKDLTKAVDLFKTAAEAGHKDADLELGRCYRYRFNDDGHVAAHVTSAVRHFGIAARQGSADAYYELGLAYLQVCCLPWLVYILRTGVLFHTHTMITWHIQGAGTLSVDAKVALENFKKAAESGHPDALFKVAQLHLGDLNDVGGGGPNPSMSLAEVRRRHPVARRVVEVDLKLRVR